MHFFSVRSELMVWILAHKTGTIWLVDGGAGTPSSVDSANQNSQELHAATRNHSGPGNSLSRRRVD